MKKIIFQAITFLILTSCSNIDRKQISLTGLWKTDSLKINFIHANLQTPKNKSIEIEKDFINSDFKLELNKDLTFSIVNQDGSTDRGTYKLKPDSIFLIKNDRNWLKFKIIENSNEVLKLMANSIRFYDVKDSSIHYFTGDNVNLRLKKLPRTRGYN
ncbi:MAG: hypothetical protein CMC96_01675 [Flavobacteriales bacterium]|nr:hypothetical protein [Flavobacteriales bacterium]|tara:strand:- start:8338 stop:8808 length:471 start_codon:yes stop_codon:yes gene_type:complete